MPRHVVLAATIETKARMVWQLETSDKARMGRSEIIGQGLSNEQIATSRHHRGQ